MTDEDKVVILKRMGAALVDHIGTGSPDQKVFNEEVIATLNHVRRLISMLEKDPENRQI
jgi:hypothetical protein